MALSPARCCLTALAVVWPLVAAAEPAPHFQPLAFLAGHCWKGTFPDGKRTDEHCFEWVFGGAFLRDRHEVGSYAGETIYFSDAGDLQYLYFNSEGGVSRGRVDVKDGVLLFPEERYTSENGTEVYRSQWRQIAPDAYAVITDLRQGDNWKEAWRMTLKRQLKRE